MSPQTYASNAGDRKTRTAYVTLVALNLALLGIVVLAAHFTAWDPRAEGLLTRITREGPVWTALLGTSVVVGWVDLLVAPVVTLHRELRRGHPAN